MKINVALLFGLIEARRNFAPEQGAWPEGSRRRQVRNELPQGELKVDLKIKLVECRETDSR